MVRLTAPGRGGLWERALRRAAAWGRGARPAPLVERLAHFRAIAAAHDAFAENLRRLEHEVVGEATGGMARVVASYESLSAPVHAMVRSLRHMGAPGADLLERRFEELDRWLAAEVLRARAIDYGPLVVWPAHPPAVEEAVVGAKAAALARLVAARAPLEVPPFFTVTVHGHRQFLEGSGVEDLLHRIVWTADPDDEQALEAACRSASEAILDATVPRALESAIAGGIATLDELVPGARLVVRPSPVEAAVGRLPGAFDAPVNLRQEQVLAAYKMVLASVYRPLTLRRLLDGGLIDADLGLGVIVMVAVTPRSAGTSGPRRGSGRGEIEIVAVHGSASPATVDAAAPDRLLVAAEPKLAVLEVAAGRRSVRRVLERDGGVRDEPLPAALRGQPPLAGDEVRRLVRDCRRIAALCGGPRAVDWAIDHQGRVHVLQVQGLPDAASGSPADRRDPIREAASRLLEAAAPGRAGDEADAGDGGGLQGIAAEAHRRATLRMLEDAAPSPRERRRARPLEWSFPMPVLLLDLGGALETSGRRPVALDEVVSVPLAALLRGIADPRLRAAGPVGFDLKGFVSVVARSAADDQRFGEPSMAVCTRDFVHFSARLAYHWATVQSVCGGCDGENLVQFVHRGGAAEAQRRELRGRFLAAVLREGGYAVEQSGDRVEAVVVGLPAAATAAQLEMVGRLMVCSRHLDMLMDSPGLARAYAAAFLAGDYAFARLGADGPDPGAA